VLRSDADGAVSLRFANSEVVAQATRTLNRRYWHNIPQ
jgi:competence protein ComEC